MGTRLARQSTANYTTKSRPIRVGPVLPPAPPGSLDALFHAAGNPYAFLDFRSLPSGGQWLRQRLLSRPLGYAAKHADWPSAFDAVFYTEVMFPSTTDGAVPEGVRTAKASGADVRAVPSAAAPNTQE